MKNLSASEKLDIVLKLISGESTAAELCTQNGIRAAKTIYNWRTRLLESAELIYAERRGAPQRDPAKLPPPANSTNDKGRSLHQPAGILFEESETERNRDMEDLYGVDDAEIEQKVSKKPKPRDQTRRGQ